MLSKNIGKHNTFKNIFTINLVTCELKKKKEEENTTPKQMLVTMRDKQLNTAILLVRKMMKLM